MTRTLLIIVFVIGLAGSVAHAQTPEGIRVRGQWTIDVRNPDGSLVEHREFDNALTNGDRFLAAVMSRSNVPGRWTVLLSNACLIDGARYDCAVTEPMSTPGPAWTAHTLEVDFCIANSAERDKKEACKGDDRPSYAVVLSGNIKAQRDGIIDRVTTQVMGCEATSSPLACVGQQFGAYSNSFTQTSLVNPVGVVTGQIVEVKVVISFSSK